MEIIIGAPLIMAVLTFLFWFLVYWLFFRWLRRKWRAFTGRFQRAPQQETSIHRVIDVDPVAAAQPATAHVVGESTKKLDIPNKLAGIKESLPAIKGRASAFLQTIPGLAKRAAATSEPAAASLSQYQVAKDGKELGSFTASAINEMLAAGLLAQQDYYLDEIANEWRPLADLLGQPH